MHAHQAFFFSRPPAMDRNQVVSLVLLIAIVLGLMLDGARAFGGAIEGDEDEEVQAPADSAAPAQRPAPVPASSQRDWSPTSRYERRFA
jgi:hypothetical protein